MILAGNVKKASLVCLIFIGKRHNPTLVQQMSNVSQKTREWVDFFIAMAAWAVSIFVVYKLMQFFIIPLIPT